MLSFLLLFVWSLLIGGGQLHFFGSVATCLDESVVAVRWGIRGGGKLHIGGTHVCFCAVVWLTKLKPWRETNGRRVMPCAGWGKATLLWCECVSNTRICFGMCSQPHSTEQRPVKAITRKLKSAAVWEALMFALTITPQNNQPRLKTQIPHSVNDCLGYIKTMF